MKNNELTNQTHALITPDHLRRLAIVYCRQSTKRQVRAEYQGSLAAVARSYGWPDSQIEIIDEDLGRSDSSAERRPGWHRLKDMIDANRWAPSLWRPSPVYRDRFMTLRSFVCWRLFITRYSSLTGGSLTSRNQTTRVFRRSPRWSLLVLLPEKGRPGNDSPRCPAGDPSGSTTTSSNCGKIIPERKRDE